MESTREGHMLTSSSWPKAKEPHRQRIPKAEVLSLPTWVWLRAGQESPEGGTDRSREETMHLQGVLSLTLERKLRLGGKQETGES